MSSLTTSIKIPTSLAQYHQRFLSALRYQTGSGPVGPDQCFVAYTSQQLKFLSDIAHAFHNFGQPQGITFFYKQAALINSAWAQNHAMLFDSRSHGSYFEALWPLPERP